MRKYPILMLALALLLGVSAVFAACAMDAPKDQVAWLVSFQPWKHKKAETGTSGKPEVPFPFPPRLRGEIRYDLSIICFANATAPDSGEASRCGGSLRLRRQPPLYRGGLCGRALPARISAMDSAFFFAAFMLH